MTDKFDRHIVKPAELRLKTESGEEDVFSFEPLPFKYIPKVYQIIDMIGSMKTTGEDGKKIGDEEKGKLFMEELIKGNGIELAQELVSVTLETSYPDILRDKRDKFALSHLWEIFGIVMEMNAGAQNVPTDIETIKKNRHKQKIAEAEAAKADDKPKTPETPQG